MRRPAGGVALPNQTVEKLAIIVALLVPLVSRKIADFPAGMLVTPLKIGRAHV
jgi:hypothetical protein